MLVDPSVDASTAWIAALRTVTSFGSWQTARGLKFKEVMGYQSMRVDMSRPVVSIAERKLGKRFLPGEAFWILSGRADVRYMQDLSPIIKNFSNDGETFDGAYGPMLIQQVRYLTECLAHDPGSRQAVATVWRPNPRPSKDIPCTVSVQLIIREGKLHCVDTMRSSDLWLGWPYDVFNFSMFSLLILLRLRYLQESFKRITLGTLTMQCGSQHIYEKDEESVENLLMNSSILQYSHLKEDEFDGPQDLLDFLERRARSTSADSHHTFMQELYR